MRRTITLSLLLTVALSSVTFSCKRKEIVETRLTRLMNKWKLVKTGTDSNGNGSIDGSEVHAVPDGFDDIFSFTQQYTGTETVTTNGVTTNYPFTWKINPALDTITRDGVGHNQIIYKMVEISSVSMQLNTFTSSGIAAYFFERK